MTGNAGCNSYFASYQLNGDKLTISNAGSTLMACLAPGVMVQEAAYLEALQKAASYQIKDQAAAPESILKEKRS